MWSSSPIPFQSISVSTRSMWTVRKLESSIGNNELTVVESDRSRRLCSVSVKRRYTEEERVGAIERKREWESQRHTYTQTHKTIGFNENVQRRIYILNKICISVNRKERYCDIQYTSEYTRRTEDEKTEETTTKHLMYWIVSRRLYTWLRACGNCERKTTTK